MLKSIAIVLIFSKKFNFPFLSRRCSISPLIFHSWLHKCFMSGLIPAMRVWSSYASRYERWYEAAMRAVIENDMKQLQKGTKSIIFRKKFQHKHSQINWFKHNQQIVNISSIFGAPVSPVWEEEPFFFAWTLKSERRKANLFANDHIYFWHFVSKMTTSCLDKLLMLCKATSKTILIWLLLSIFIPYFSEQVLWPNAVVTFHTRVALFAKYPFLSASSYHPSTATKLDMLIFFYN